MDKKLIADKLNELEATLPCHRCGNDSFTILEGFTNITLQDDYKNGVVIGGKTVPVVHVACSKCGNISSHAIGVLGFMDSQQEGS